MNELSLGRLGRSHGVEGKIKFYPWSGETAHLLNLKTASLRRGEQILVLDVESIDDCLEYVLLKFRDYDSPEKVSELSGMELWGSREMAAPLNKDQFYYADLCSSVLVLDKKNVGKVVSVCDGGNGKLLEVEKNNDSKVFIPFIKEFIGSIDVNSKTIELLESWILDQADED